MRGGKAVGPLSLRAADDEVLLLPGTRFFVTRAPYEEDGWQFVDMEEQEGAWLVDQEVGPRTLEGVF